MGLLATSRTNAGLVTKVPSIQSDHPQNVRTLNCRRVSTPLSRRLSGARRTDRDSDDCQIARGPLMILNEINGLPGSVRSWRGCGQSACFPSLRCWLRSRYHLRVRGPVMASPLDLGPRVRKDGGPFFLERIGPCRASDLSACRRHPGKAMVRSLCREPSGLVRPLCRTAGR
jgi:hypothetical protein